MKKIAALAIMAILTLGFSGCYDTSIDETNTTTEVNGTATTEVTEDATQVEATEATEVVEVTETK